MSDRMLSDEILLALIKKNGGGTTDYEALENLPEINSVELKGNKSLSDLGIASAQDVKKEFIGTLAEWNALTPAQQKAFDTYQITDDYSEALIPNYSTTEQKTGQKWIDGKDVYFKTIEYGALPNNTYKDVSSGLSNVNILEIKVFCDDGANFLTIPRPAIDNNYAIELSYNYSLNSVRIATKVDMTSYNATAILYYTKTA